MIGRALAVAAAVLVPVPVSALSCAAPSVARSFEEARAAAEVYAVVLGRFEFERPDGAASVLAIFEGRVLGSDGFVAEARRPVMLEISCAASWCGEIASRAETLAFVEQGAEGLSVAVTPCPQWVFVEPTPEQVATAESCMKSVCE